MSVCKRVFDAGFSALGLLLSFPILLLIALFVYLDSPGPVIFSQKRLKKNGKTFLMHKFRKFPSDWGTKGPGVTTSGDVRMTRVGRVLERTKLDELPQLWNILKGEMSFVGPRPESTRYQNLFVGEYAKVLDFTPGIFGPNQVVYRNESAMYPNDVDPEVFYKTELFPNKAKADIEYFSASTCWSDINWIIKGIWGTIAGIVDWGTFFERHFLVILIDFILIELAWIFAHWFRFGFSMMENNFSVLITGSWLLPILMLPLMLICGCYRHPVRYFSLSDVIRLILGVSSSWIFSFLIIIGFFHRDTSISLALLGLMLLLIFLITPRIWRRERWLMQNDKTLDQLRHVLIYGASLKGNALAKYLDTAFSNVRIVGYLDEDVDHRGRFINGHRVLGSWRDIDVIADRISMNEIWVSEAVPNVDDSLIEFWAAKRNIKCVFLYQMEAFSEV